MIQYEVKFTYPNNKELTLIVDKKEVLKCLMYNWNKRGDTPLNVSIKEVDVYDD